MTNQYEHYDSLIITAATTEWEKVAVVISKVFDDPSFDAENTTAQHIAERIYILVDAGQLAVQGNMRRWRDGAVKLA